MFRAGTGDTIRAVFLYVMKFGSIGFNFRHRHHELRHELIESKMEFGRIAALQEGMHEKNRSFNMESRLRGGALS
jgi:hypothetical protein